MSAPFVIEVLTQDQLIKAELSRYKEAIELVKSHLEKHECDKKEALLNDMEAIINGCCL